MEIVKIFELSTIDLLGEPLLTSVVERFQWRSRGGGGGGGAQGARAPPSALGLVNIVHRTASSSTPLATLNHQLLLKNSLEDNQKLILSQNSVENLDFSSLATCFGDDLNFDLV